MITEELAALAAAGGNALVKAMVTDGWEGIKKRFAHLLGRRDEKKTEIAAAQLEKAHTTLAGLSGADLKTTQAEQEIVWRTRLADLLESNPGIDGELKALVEQVEAQVVGLTSQIEQRAVAFDQAKQVVQGYGVLNVTFGGQDGPDNCA